MPQTTAINADQREGLFELIRNHLDSIEDLWVALERSEDFALAERLAASSPKTSVCSKTSGGSPMTGVVRSS